MTLPPELFSACAQDAEKYLSAAGYIMDALKQDKASGSRSATYTKGDETIVLNWDESSATLHIQKHNARNDEELFYRGGLRLCTREEYERATRDAVKLLHDHLHAHHDHDDENTCGCAHHHA